MPTGMLVQKGKNNMKYIISIITLLLVGCASNLPFADINDVLQLEAGMSKSNVENILGPPIKLSGNDSKEIWLYDYRTLENKRLDWAAPVKGNSPSKINGASEFYCTFNNNQLIEWGSCIDDCFGNGGGINTNKANEAGLISKIMDKKYYIGAGLAAGYFVYKTFIYECEDEDCCDDWYEYEGTGNGECLD